jgi:hypothetical protein
VSIQRIAGSETKTFEQSFRSAAKIQLSFRGANLDISVLLGGHPAVTPVGRKAKLDPFTVHMPAWCT